MAGIHIFWVYRYCISIPRNPHHPKKYPVDGASHLCFHPGCTGDLGFLECRESLITKVVEFAALGVGRFICFVHPYSNMVEPGSGTDPQLVNNSKELGVRG